MKEQMARVRPPNHNERVRVYNGCLCVSLDRILSKGLLEEGDNGVHTQFQCHYGRANQSHQWYPSRKKPSSFPGSKILGNMHAF